MFGAAIIVFRESLEAALFVGIIAAATRGLSRRGWWLAGGVALGALGSLALAGAAGEVSAWANGLGQEIVNASILAVALAMLLWHCIWVSAHGRELATQARRLGSAVQGGQRPPRALIAVVALAVLREGAETVLFVGGSITGAALDPGQVLWGAALGLAAGVALGAALYAGLARIPPQRLFAVTNVLIALLAAAIASQLARVAAQAGWIERGSAPLWDSSAWLADDSAPGALLHAMVGYTAQPSALQLACWAGVLALIAVGTRWAGRRAPTSRPIPVG